MTFVYDDDKPFKIVFQRCSGCVKLSVRSLELLYIAFLHAVIDILRLYPEELDPKTSLF